MYRLYGFSSQNSLKALYVIEAVGVDYEFVYVNLMKGEQRSESFLEKTPVGKVPLLEYDGEYLFESGAICRYLASVAKSPLYPTDNMQRGRIDQWLDFFSCHLGRWLSKLYFEQIIKPKAGLGERDKAGCEEAEKFALQQLALIDSQLSDADWIANNQYSIADLVAFAYIEQVHAIELPMENYPNVSEWLERMSSQDSIANAIARLPK